MDAASSLPSKCIYCATGITKQEADEGDTTRFSTAQLRTGSGRVPVGEVVDVIGPRIGAGDAVLPMLVDVVPGNIGGTPVTHFIPVNIPTVDTKHFLFIRYCDAAGRCMEGWVEQQNIALPNQRVTFVGFPR